MHSSRPRRTTAAAQSFGSFRGRALALGPLAGKTVEVWKLPIDVIVKCDLEFAPNRSTGNELWLTGGLRF